MPRHGSVKSMVEERPLSARSVVASVLLGMGTPEQSGQRLVRTAELFGLAEGTTRVALSRMVGTGELTMADGRYRLAGPLLARRDRQESGRRPVLRKWDGRWRLAVVGGWAGGGRPAGAPAGKGRPAGARAGLRRSLHAVRLAEWREGLWARPDNLPGPWAAVPGCIWLVASPEDDSFVADVVGWWNLPEWVVQADTLRGQMAATMEHLEAERTEALASCFMIAAAVVRHLARDPLLPETLLPARWPGSALRGDYDRYERAYQRLLRACLRGLPR